MSNLIGSILEASPRLPSNSKYQDVILSGGVRFQLNAVTDKETGNIYRLMCTAEKIHHLTEEDSLGLDLVIRLTGSVPVPNLKDLDFQTKQAPHGTWVDVDSVTIGYSKDYDLRFEELNTYLEALVTPEELRDETQAELAADSFDQAMIAAKGDDIVRYAGRNEDPKRAPRVIFEIAWEPIDENDPTSRKRPVNGFLRSCSIKPLGRVGGQIVELDPVNHSFSREVPVAREVTEGFTF